MMAAHYGDGHTVCPMAGLRAPELADGRVSKVLDVAWSTVHAQTLTAHAPDIPPISAAQQILLEQEMSHARAAMTLWLKVKLDFWQRLPWCLAALAVISEGPQWTLTLHTSFVGCARVEGRRCA